MQIPETIEKKKFLMDMIMTGRHEHSEEILGSVFVFRALDDEETTNSYKEASGFDIVAKTPMVRRSLLSRALVSISFKETGKWVPANTGEADILLSKMAPNLVEHIFNKYDAMTKYRDLLIEQALGIDPKDTTLKN